MTRVLRLVFCTIVLVTMIGFLRAHQPIDGSGKRHDKFVEQPALYEQQNDDTSQTEIQDEQCPEIQKLESLVSFYQETGDWTALLEVGDMYARGCYPFYGSAPKTALALYQVASRCPDRVVAARALSSFANARTNPVSRRDSVGQPFPQEIASGLIGIAERRVRETPFHEFNYRLRVKYLRPRPTDPVPDAAPVVATLTAIEAPAVPPLVLDKQNVHDHAISQATKKNVKHVVAANEAGDEFDRVELIDSVMSELTSVKNVTESKLSDSFRVLTSLVPDKIESMGCSQLDVLNATFRKILGVEDPNLRDNLLEALGNNLASGIERDRVVCSTGKIARIVSTLEGTDLVHNKSVPIEVIRREIGTLASKIRDDVLSGVTDNDRNAYNSSTTLHDLSDRMRERFQAQVNATYVVGLGLSPKVLWPLVEVYMAEF
ncbi:unnamed protein product [Ectocarpus sp. 12 AP-2014]